MRKKLVLVLALVMIVSTALPGVAFAKEDPGLEDAIKRVKQLLVIPEETANFLFRKFQRRCYTVESGVADKRG